MPMSVNHYVISFSDPIIRSLVVRLTVIWIVNSMLPMSKLVVSAISIYVIAQATIPVCSIP